MYLFYIHITRFILLAVMSYRTKLVKLGIDTRQARYFWHQIYSVFSCMKVAGTFVSISPPGGLVHKYIPLFELP